LDLSALHFSWRSALLLFAAAHLVTAAALLCRRRTEAFSNRVLAVLLIAVVLAFIPQIIGFAGFYDVFPQLTFAPFNVTLAYGPLVYAYSGALVLGRLPAPGLWLFAPAALQFVYYSVNFVRMDWEAKFAFSRTFHGPYIAPLEAALALIFGVAGVAASARLQMRYNRFLAQNTSEKAQFDARWFSAFLAAMGAVFALAIGFELWGFVVGGLSYVQGFWFYLAVGLICYALALTALIAVRQPFPKLQERTPEPRPETVGRNWALEAQTLRQRILEEGWHLEPQLSLAELAKRMATNESYLSRAINQGCGHNFNRFVNGLRVDAAKARLRNSSDDILTIAFDSGFNSKATFNRVFREIAGVTPRAWRTQTSQIP